MNPNNLKEVVIVDDLEIEGPIRDILNVSKYHKVNLNRLCTLDKIAEWIKQEKAQGKIGPSRSPKGTLFLVNAHVKFQASDRRYQMLGARFIRYEFRTLWKRQEPVITYSPLSRDIFTNIPHHRIFKTEIYHGFLSTTELANLPDQIEKMNIIPEDELTEQRLRCFSLPELVAFYKHDLDGAMTVYRSKDRISSLASVNSVIDKIRNTCTVITELIPDEFHDEFAISELLAECRNLENDVAAGIARIEAITKSYSDKAMAKLKELY